MSWRDQPRSGSPSDFDPNDLREWNAHKSARKLALYINTSQSTICRHLKKCFSLWEELGRLHIQIFLQSRKMTHSSGISLQARKNVSLRKMFNAKGNRLTKMNFHRLLQRWSCMEENLCYVYGGITSVLFLLSI